MTDITIEQDPVRAAVIADSVSDGGIRLTTLQLRYPRFIHSELMTHRVFSRNARSSRAVPVEKLLQEPIYMPKFQKNQKGMQAVEFLDDTKNRRVEEIWGTLAEITRQAMAEMSRLEVHKQWANRPLEWFGFIDVLVTSTDWANWFALRNHLHAMPEIQQLAKAMLSVIDESEPVYRASCSFDQESGWHLPYIYAEERLTIPLENLKRISAARSARVSYKPFEGEGSIDADLVLFERLLESAPLHASPAEHQATPDYLVNIGLAKGSKITAWAMAHEHGNLYGWRQFRKMLPDENILDEHYM